MSCNHGMYQPHCPSCWEALTQDITRLHKSLGAQPMTGTEEYKRIEGRLNELLEIRMNIALAEGRLIP